MREINQAEQAAKIFIRAANYIRRYGWQVRGMGSYGQPRCSMGALESAYPEAYWDRNLSGLMYRALREGLAGMTLTEFNETYRDGERVARLYEQIAGSLVRNNELVPSG